MTLIELVDKLAKESVLLESGDLQACGRMLTLIESIHHHNIEGKKAALKSNLEAMIMNDFDGASQGVEEVVGQIVKIQDILKSNGTFSKPTIDIFEKQGNFTEKPQEPVNLEVSKAHEGEVLQPETIHILVVDDEKSLRHLIQRVVIDAGYKCSVAEDGKCALEILEANKLEANKIDVVITDIRMPGISGIELTKIVKKKYNADVIVMTGFAENVLYEDVIGKGASDFIQKPFSFKELIVRLKHVLMERATLAGLTNTENKLNNSISRLTRVLEQTVNALATAFEKRDPYTAGHEQRVTKLACAISSEMGLSEEVIEGIRIAGLLHDIGKISIPIDILNKPGELNKHEFNLIKEHPQVGYDILKNVEFDQPIADIILQHHERINGTGYPNRSSGDDIILQARILAVSDVVEAMSSHRPYRPALGIETALEEITLNKGAFYDAETVDVCLRLFNGENILIMNSIMCKQ